MNDAEAEEWLRAVLRLADADGEVAEEMIADFNTRKAPGETVADVYLREIAHEIEGRHA